MNKNKSHISKDEERYFIKKIIEKYEKDDTIMALKRFIVQSEEENRVLKAELDEVKLLKERLKKEKHPNHELQMRVHKNKLSIKNLTTLVQELQYQFIAMGYKLPERLSKCPKTIVKEINNMR